MANQDQGPLQIGSLFENKYEIIGLIGEGGYAHVYEGRHRFMGHRVAIKLLRPGIGEEMLRRAQAEAQFQKRTRNRYIVEVFDADITSGGRLYIVMERLDGRPLREALLQYGRLTEEEVLRLFLKIVQAMQVAHEHGAIHRDLKPENIFLIAGNDPKVLDFGIAKLSDTAAWVTMPDRVLGTIYYMSPEQLQADPLTARSDIYAIGVMMYEALYRHPIPLLITAPDPSLMAVARIVIQEVPPPLHEMEPSISPAVAALVARAMAKLPGQRFASMAELGTAIAHLLEPHDARRARARTPLVERELWERPVDRSGLKKGSGTPRAVEVESLLALVGTQDTAPASRPLFSEELPADFRPTAAALGAGTRTQPLESPPRPRPQHEVAPSPPAPPPSASSGAVAELQARPFPAPRVVQPTAAEPERRSPPPHVASVVINAESDDVEEARAAGVPPPFGLSLRNLSVASAVALVTAAAFGVVLSPRSTATPEPAPVVVASASPVVPKLPQPAPPAPQTVGQPAASEAAAAPPPPAAPSLEVPVPTEPQQVATRPAPARPAAPKKPSPIDKIEERRLRVAEDLRREKLSQEETSKPKFTLPPRGPTNDAAPKAAPSRETLF
ncbi:MAG TPA: protein kinase [Polyangiaceae bacterium]|nr:protein kinase [Polyangiaceae bacterium]